MLGEVVASHESLLAVLALKVLFSSVGLEVPVKLIRSCELAVTEWPVAHIRLFSCVCAEMSFKVRGLPIHFATARIVANVGASFWSLTGFLYLETVGAYTVGSLGGLTRIGRGEHKRNLPIQRHHLALGTRSWRGAYADLGVQS